MNSYRDHPLYKSSATKRGPVDAGLEMEANAGNEVDPSRTLKRRIGSWLYPLKNALQRGLVEHRLRSVGVAADKIDEPDIICFGQKGFANEIFLSQIRPLVGNLGTIVCFGCGAGQEVALVSRVLRPRRVIGLDFFSYQQAWSRVTQRVKTKFGVEVNFERLDLQNDRTKEACHADMVISFSVLEHLREMDDCLENISGFLNGDGFFASLWGPLWYSYSGDHISVELGFEHAYEHLELSASDYWAFYLNHPRNRADVSVGKPTWLELGLHNFARYDEYIASLERWFGPVQFLKWQLSQEAFRWAKAYPNRWQRILGAHPGVTPLDLALGGAAVLARNREAH